MKEACFCYNNPYFVFQESRGASSLLKDSIPITDFSLPGSFEAHGLRRGYALLFCFFVLNCAIANVKLLMWEENLFLNACFLKKVLGT